MIHSWELQGDLCQLYNSSILLVSYLSQNPDPRSKAYAVLIYHSFSYQRERVILNSSYLGRCDCTPPFLLTILYVNFCSERGHFYHSTILAEDFQKYWLSTFFGGGKLFKFDSPKTFHGIMWVPIKDVGQIGFAVSTFIGYKQLTNT